MPFRIATAIIAGVFGILLGVWAFLRNRHGEANQNFAVWNILLAIWAFDETLVYVGDHQKALFLYRLCNVAASFIGFFFLKFIFSITKYRLSWPYHLIKWTAFPFALFSATPLIIKDIQFSNGHSTPIIEVPGALYNFFLIYFLLTLAYALYGVIQSYRTSSGSSKNQLRYVSLATIMGIVALVIFIVSQFYPAVPSLQYFVEMVISSIFAYTIVKHRLMDIRLFVRRIALLISIYGLLILVAIPFLGILHSHYLASYPQISRLIFIEVVFFSAVLSVGPFVYAYLVRESSYFHEHEMAGITHDLKSPLGTIQNALDYLMGVKPNKVVSQKDVDYLDMIRRNVGRMEEEVDKILAIFQLPTKVEPFKFEIHDLCAMIQSVTDEFWEVIKAKGLELKLSLSVVSCPIRCDEEKIHQVLPNLLSNAVKFTETGWIALSLTVGDRAATISVQDSGQGIPSHELSEVFDRLFQGATSRNLKGSGIGLTIAKTWVEAHGGEIHAESDGPGKGSRFWFTLPKNL